MICGQWRYISTPWWKMVNAILKILGGTDTFSKNFAMNFFLHTMCVSQVPPYWQQFQISFHKISHSFAPQVVDCPLPYFISHVPLSNSPYHLTIYYGNHILPIQGFYWHKTHNFSPDSLRGVSCRQWDSPGKWWIEKVGDFLPDFHSHCLDIFLEQGLYCLKACVIIFSKSDNDFAQMPSLRQMDIWPLTLSSSNTYMQNPQQCGHMHINDCFFDNCPTIYLLEGCLLCI